MQEPQPMPPNLQHYTSPLPNQASPTIDPLQQIRRGLRKGPRRIFLYGIHGVGKSEWASKAQKPIFIPTEDGLDDIDCESFPLARSFGEVMGYIRSLLTSPHEYMTAVIDSLDWLEPLIWNEVCIEFGVASMADIDYGKGYLAAIDKWQAFLRALDALRSDRGMTIILIGHSEIKRFNDPENNPYDQYAPRLHKDAAELVKDWCSEVLFATYKVFTRQISKDFGKEKHQGIGTGERVLRTTKRPSHIAKNRLRLPDEIPLSYEWFEYYVRGDHLQVQVMPDQAAAASQPQPQPA